MKYFFLFFILSFQFIIAQNITLIEYPKNNQHYVRNINTNVANVIVDGNINYLSGFNSLILKIYKNDLLINSLNYNIDYNIYGVDDFYFNVEISAELSNYTFTLTSDTNEIIKHSYGITAGDVYIINGQSNSIRHSFGDNPFPFQNNFIKTYLSNGNWSIDSNPFTFGGIGYWFSDMIVNYNGIPIAIFNGGEGGKPISYFQRNDSNIYDQTTNYGRLLQRYNDAGFSPENVKAIIWYQGESNGNSLGSYYENQFTNLYEDWENDYNPDKYYVFQVHSGCGISITSDIPEVLRKLPFTFSNLTTISTNGAIQGIDNCHYIDTDGYTVLAQRLYNLLAFDFYNSGNNSGIYSPNISNTRFNNIEKNSISFDVIPFSDSYTLENGIEQDFIIEGSTIYVTSASLLGNTVTLNLSGSCVNAFSSLTYLGRNMSNTPFIKNQNSIGMLSFKNVLINEYNAPIPIQNGAWTYYYNPNNLSDPIFGIEHLPSGIGANTTIFNALISINTHSNVINATYGYFGNFCLAKYWNINSNPIPNGWVNIRFFYDPILQANLINYANTFTTNSNQTVSNLLYIQTNQIFNPISSIIPMGFNNVPISKCGIMDHYGVYNNNNYLQLNQVQLATYTGGGVVKNVSSSYEITPEAGTIRFNDVIHKFQGWNGTQWVDFN